MTLSEIETILQELAARHPHLTVELLTTLLVASGWEEKTIKEALVLFGQQKGVVKSVIAAVPTKIAPQPSAPEVASPVTESVITFYQPDGREEGKLHAFAAGVSEKSKRVEKKITPALVVEIQSEQPLALPEVITPVLEQVSQEEALVHEAQKILEPIEIEVVPILEQTLESSVVVPAVPVVSVAPTTEPQSLITHEDIPEKRSPEKQGVLPSNLPLLPFESSPHIWSFAKYKDVFHKEATVQEEIKVINVMPQEASSFVVKEKVFEEKPYIKIGEDVEVVMETIPLRKDDKPLVFLATIMLLAIIVILGYMYSNGRL